MNYILRKRFLIFPIIITMLSMSFPAFSASNAAERGEGGKGAAFELESKSAILTESTTGRILYEKNSHEKLAPASVTKVMSVLLFMEAIDSGRIKYDDIVTISDHAQSMGGSQVYLAAGEQMTVRDLMKAVVVSSANDGTVALAEHIAGSEESFVAMMNDKAKELGMKDTNFVNCSGLDTDNHYTSAYDISLMSAELINKHPGVTQFTTIWMDTLRGGEFGLANTNKLIKHYKGANGLKTGSTSKAGFCISASAKRDDFQLISVIMAAPNSKTRFLEASKLLNYGFANYQTVTVRKKGDSEGEADVVKGLKPKVKAVYPEDVKVLIKKGEEKNIKLEVILDEKVVAPVKAGQKIGEAVYRVGDTEAARVNLTAEENIEKVSVWNLLKRMISDWSRMGKN